MTKKRLNRDSAEKLVAALAGAGNDDIAADKFIVGIIQHVGGQDAFTRLVADFVKDPKVAVTARARMMVMVADFTKYYTEQKLKSKPNLEDLATEDVQALFTKLVNKARPELSEAEWRALGHVKGWKA